MVLDAHGGTGGVAAEGEDQQLAFLGAAHPRQAGLGAAGLHEGSGVRQQLAPARPVTQRDGHTSLVELQREVASTDGGGHGDHLFLVGNDLIGRNLTAGGNATVGGGGVQLGDLLGA